MVPVIVLPFRARSARPRLLRRGALDVDRPRTLRAIGHLEFHSITFAKIGNALAIDGRLVEEIVLAGLTLDEPEALVYSQRPNCSGHVYLSDFWCWNLRRTSAAEWLVRRETRHQRRPLRAQLPRR